VLRHAGQRRQGPQHAVLVDCVNRLSDHNQSVRRSDADVEFYSTQKVLSKLSERLLFQGCRRGAFESV
jgi:hypothetical protein